MSRTRIVGGNITKITGGSYKMYAKDNIEFHSNRQVIQTAKEGIFYGTPDEHPAPPILAKALVHFRPGKNWEGKGYGFDYMRTREDPGLLEKAYVDLISKHYLDSAYHNLEMAENSTEGYYQTDTSLYTQLKQEYRVKSVAWKDQKEKTGKITEKGEYFCSWISMYPANIRNEKNELVPSGFSNTKATLTLKFDIYDAPDKFIIKENKYFKMSPMEFSVKTKGKTTMEDVFTIECLEDFPEDQSITVYAVKGNVELPCGEMMVWANDTSKRKEIEVVMVEVTTPPISDIFKKTGKITHEIEVLNTYLKQALISIKPNPQKVSLDTTTPDHIRDIDDYIDRNKKSVLIENKFRPFRLDWYLSGILEQKYQKMFKFFILGENFPFDKKASRTVAYSEYEAHFLLLTPAEDGDRTAVIVHEFLHAMGLAHTFTNAEASKGRGKYTYSSGNTENFMDYYQTVGNPPYHRYMLWRWQWELANNGAEKFIKK